ncbi:MAG TPA: YqcC family protein [Chloroflexia bacterium]
MPDYETARQKIDAIEAEMKRLGMWSAEPLSAEAYDFKTAFAMDTMPFSHWLQFIFIPRVREIIAKEGKFPDRSQVGAQAIRELDGMYETTDLVSLLSDFDYFIERG